MSDIERNGNFYRLLFGENPNADKILASLGLSVNDIERYRDAELVKLPEVDEYGIEYSWAGDHIRITTRTGGNNRRSYHNDKLTHHPLFEWTEDDEDDSTYALYYFKLPES